MTIDKDFEDDSADEFKIGDLPVEEDELEAEDEDDSVDCSLCGEPLDLVTGECVNPDCDASA